MNPVVSIITPSFNRADLVAETADSIFRQTYPHWEWVVVDDGSSDNSAELFENWSRIDSRVRFFHRDRNPKGACACRNLAIEKSTGDYLIFLDTDDLLATFCLEQRVGAMLQHPNADFMIFPMLMFKKKPDDLKLLWNIDKPINDIDRLLWGDAVCQGTGTLWKKNRFVELGGWDENLLLWQDVELHLRVLGMNSTYHKAMHLSPDVFIRISEESLSRTGFNRPEKLRSRMAVLAQLLALYAGTGKLEQHRTGFRHMFTHLFLTICRSGQVRFTNELLQVPEITHLFSLVEIRHLKRYARAASYKLTRFSWLEKQLHRAMPQAKYSGEITLTNQHYTKEVSC
jgi:glycosyltransferase involved in cell wall biosynthesis